MDPSIEKKHVTDDYIERVSSDHDASDLTALSSIEATAASKAAWLISITVSIGGFLFGTNATRCLVLLFVQRNADVYT